MRREVLTGLMARITRSFLGTVVGILLSSYFAAADSVTLVWDPNTEPDLAGYKIYYGTNSGQWNITIDVGNVTNVTISGLVRGVTYYFVATAYNTANLESDPSNEVSYAVPENVPPHANGETLAISSGKPTRVSATKLLANDSDPDGDTLSILTVNPTSAHGGTVTFDSEAIVYSPPPEFVGIDEISYVVSDGHGGTDVGKITVTVNSTDETSTGNNPEDANESALVQFSGIPGVSYIIEVADQPGGPWVNLSGPLKADPTGLIEYIDNTSPKPSTRAYRLVALIEL